MAHARNPNLVFSVLILCFDAVLAVKLINTASGGSGFLLAGVERMALGANLHVDLLLRRTGYEFVAAVASNFCLIVLRMDTFFHDLHLFTFLKVYSL